MISVFKLIGLDGVHAVPSDQSSASDERSSSGHVLSKDGEHHLDRGDLRDQGAAEAAYLDLELLVYLQERRDWIIDREAIAANIERAAEVFCQLTPEGVRALERIFESKGIEIGQTRAAYLSAKNARREVSIDMDRLHEERILMLVKAVKLRAGECPFWLEPQREFAGIHRDAGRLQLLFESMAGAQFLKREDQDLKLGWSAQARMLGIYGVSTRWGMGMGIEAGGATLFPKSPVTGERVIRAQMSAGLPILFRGWYRNFRIDAELAGVARLHYGAALSEGSAGIRVSAGFGFPSIRVFDLLPHLIFWGGSETYFLGKPMQVFRLGTRFGINL